MQTSKQDMIARAKASKLPPSNSTTCVVKIISKVECDYCAKGWRHSETQCTIGRSNDGADEHTLHKRTFASYEEAWAYAHSHAPIGALKTNKKGFAIARGKTSCGMTVKLITKAKKAS